MYCQVKSFTI